MKSVLVNKTSISFNVDKSHIKDSTPAKDIFFYKNGIEEYLKETSNIKSKLFANNFCIKSDLKYYLS